MVQGQGDIHAKEIGDKDAPCIAAIFFSAVAIYLIYKFCSYVWVALNG